MKKTPIEMILEEHYSHTEKYGHQLTTFAVLENLILIINKYKLKEEQSEKIVSELPSDGFLINEGENKIEISHPDFTINSIVEKKFVTYNYIKSLQKQIEELKSEVEKAKELLNEYYNHLVEQDKATGLNVYSDKMKSRILKIIIPS